MVIISSWDYSGRLMVIMKFPIVQLWPGIPVLSAYNPIEIECIVQ
jgi:hypothetical protein